MTSEQRMMEKLQLLQLELLQKIKRWRAEESALQAAYSKLESIQQELEEDIRNW